MHYFFPLHMHIMIFVERKCLEVYAEVLAFCFRRNWYKVLIRPLLPLPKVLFSFGYLPFKLLDVVELFLNLTNTFFCYFLHEILRNALFLSTIHAHSEFC